jgi:predicted lysophospholipase L1 biosynthesis ABC-type transport system permease subunit
MFGRLARDRTVEEARAEIAALVPPAWTRAGEGANSGVTVFHPRGARHRPSADQARSVTLLALAAGVLLLVCCANLAGLTAARGASRSRELAIRRSLGASRLRLVSQLMTESLLLACAGGAGGLALSLVLVRIINTTFYQVDVEGRPLHFAFTTDGRVVAAVLGVSALAAVVVGLAPALRSMRTGTVETLRGGMDATGRSPWARSLVTAQAAVAVGLAALAVLLDQSASRRGVRNDSMPTPEAM